MASKYPNEYESDPDWETDTSYENDSSSETESIGGKHCPFQYHNINPFVTWGSFPSPPRRLRFHSKNIFCPHIS